MDILVLFILLRLSLSLFLEWFFVSPGAPAMGRERWWQVNRLRSVLRFLVSLLVRRVARLLLTSAGLGEWAFGDAPKYLKRAEMTSWT